MAARKARIVPMVFGIGLPCSGGHILGHLFEAHGHVWHHHRSGKLAADIAYCRVSGDTPLTHWPEATGFSGLYRYAPRHLPAVGVQSIIQTLRYHFPDAYFIHTHRDPDDWIAARFMADGGDHRACVAWHQGVRETDLPDLWTQENGAHRMDCRAVFGSSDRFLDFNTTSEPIDKVYDFLSADFDLRGDGVAIPVLARPQGYNDARNAAQTAPPDTDMADMTFARQVIDFCSQTEGSKGASKSMSKIGVRWGQDGVIRDKAKRILPFQRTNPVGPYLVGQSGTDFVRAQATLNEMIAHGAKPPLRLDMMDARRIGVPPSRAAPPRTVVYNRLPGATNLTLWPLPGYHTLAPTGTGAGYPRDTLSFADKADRAVWLGNMTGRMAPLLTPKGRTKTGAMALRDQMWGLDPNDPAWDQIIADLTCIPRYNIVTTFHEHPDFEVGLVLRSKWKQLSQTPAFAGLSRPLEPRTFFHQFRYVLSLSGNDTGSNFLQAAASNSLILKEEDGWELFYTDAFKPWVHYVPLDPGAQDVQEKLDWARARPKQSEAMANAATEVFGKFASPASRKAILTGIVDRLNADVP